MSNQCTKGFAQNEFPHCLRIRTDELLALPYSHLLHVGGSDRRLRISFGTHDLTIHGEALALLWEDIAQHRIAEIRVGKSEDLCITAILTDSLEGEPEADQDAERELSEAIDKHLE